MVFLCKLCFDIDKDDFQCEQHVHKNNEKTRCKRPSKSYDKDTKLFICEYHLKKSNNL
jgi:hypothetical protein